MSVFFFFFDFFSFPSLKSNLFLALGLLFLLLGEGRVRRGVLLLLLLPLLRAHRDKIRAAMPIDERLKVRVRARELPKKKKKKLIKI
jgi:hypothetical protein